MSKIKILYVEDEPYLGKIVKESLESRDFNVRMMEDGRGIVSAVDNFQPNICVLDVMLPYKDGFTLGKEIRESNPSLPIIYLTAKSQTKDLLKGFQSGGNDYIKKPFSMEELIVRIQNILQLSNSHTTNTSQTSLEEIPLGEYLFYPKKFELHHYKNIQKLSHRETQLLEIFSKHQNQAIPRKKILLEVWQDDSIFNSRNLDVYIKKIRDYLKADSKLKIITMKGVGYHFVVE